MPGGDGTGPRGMGPRTGRGLGYCNGYQTPGYANPANGGYGYGRGLGRGYGRGFGGGYGRGFGHGYGMGYGRQYWAVAPPPLPATQPVFDEKVYKKQLENEVDFLKQRMEQLQKELEKLDSKEE